MKPFVAAIDAGVSSVMPYYGVPVNVTHQGVRFEETGFAFSRAIVTDLLRTRLGFTGYVNSDTGIINDRAWGLEQRTIPERVAAAINGGIDVLSGFSTNATITDLVTAGLVSQGRVDEAATRLLTEQFRLGCSRIPTSTPRRRRT
jgi:beta-glucosidase